MIMRIILVIILQLFAVFSEEIIAQTPDGKQSRGVMRKYRRKEKKNKYTFNPNLDKDTNKSKHLASKALAKDNKKVERQQRRAIRKQKRYLRRKKGAYRK